MMCIYESVIPELKALAKKRLNSLSKSSAQQYADFKNYIVPLIVDCKEIMLYIPEVNDVDNDETGKKNCIKTAPSPPPTESVESIFSLMKHEIHRLKSFQKGWTVSFLKPSDLAAVGLFYLGTGDRVECVFCRGIISDWVKGDDPSKEHVKHFPMCPFLLGCDVGNIPIKDDALLQASNTCYRDSLSNPQPSTSSNVLIPKYPLLNNIDKRLKTFSTWTSSVCRPEQLAECGFFYSGQSDIVTCFCCGGRVGCWEPEDQPWVEHAKHFPQCAYVMFIKGSTFIDSVQTQGGISYTNQQNCNTASMNDVTGNATGCMELPETNELLKDLTISQESSLHPTGSVNKSPTKYLCKICMEERPRVAFLPCGHSLTCPICAAALSVCPMCRTKIDSFIRIYFD